MTLILKFRGTALVWTFVFCEKYFLFSKFLCHPDRKRNSHGQLDNYNIRNMLCKFAELQQKINVHIERLLMHSSRSWQKLSSSPCMYKTLKILKSCILSGCRTLGLLVSKINNTKSSMKSMKSNDVMKQKNSRVSKEWRYPKVELLPEDGLYW